MTAEHDRPNPLTEYLDIAKKKEKLEREIGAGLFRDGQKLAAGGIKRNRLEIAVFKFPERSSELLVISDKLLESVTFALVTPEEQGTIIRYVEVNEDGMFKDVDAQKSEKSPFEWIKYQVNNYNSGLFEEEEEEEEEAEATLTAEEKSEGVNQAGNDTYGEEDQIFKEILDGAFDDDSEPVEPHFILESMFRMHRAMTVDRKPNPRFLEDISRVIRIIDPAKDHVTQLYMDKSTKK